jgi:Holliday junction DNA helicase RuvA
VLERLPANGSRIQLYTELVVKEDGWALFGFDRAGDRTVFQRLLSASGFGPKLALALLSTLGAERTVRSIRQRDIAALSTVSGIGKKKAERLVLELYDRFAELPAELPPVGGRPGEEAVVALGRLGYPPAQAEAAVRDALAGGGKTDTAQLIRRALQGLASKK